MIETPQLNVERKSREHQLSRNKRGNGAGRVTRRAAGASAQSLASVFSFEGKRSCVIDNGTCGSGQGNHWTDEYQSQVSRLASMFSELEAMHKCGEPLRRHHRTIQLRNDRSSERLLLSSPIHLLYEDDCISVACRRPTQQTKRHGSIQPEENGRKSLRRTITLHIFSLIIEKMFQLDESRLLQTPFPEIS